MFTKTRAYRAPEPAGSGSPNADIQLPCIKRLRPSESGRSGADIQEQKFLSLRSKPLPFALQMITCRGINVRLEPDILSVGKCHVVNALLMAAIIGNLKMVQWAVEKGECQAVMPSIENTASCVKFSLSMSLRGYLAFA